MHEELAQLRVQGHKLDNVIEWLYLVLTKDLVGGRRWKTELFISSSETLTSRVIVVNEIYSVSGRESRSRCTASAYG